jgi:hypothetical protein
MADLECPWCPSGTPQLDLAARSAAIKGKLQSIRELSDQGVIMDALVMLHAAAGGHVECMRFLYEECNVGFEYVFAPMPFHCNAECMHLSCCTVSGAGGHLNAMRFAHERGSVIDESTVQFAARKCYTCEMTSPLCEHGTCFEYASLHMRFYDDPLMTL